MVKKLVDVHAHLTHGKFDSDLNETIQRAEATGLGAIVVNGLEPKSNRRILELAKLHPIIKPALGIYPIDAINQLKPDLPFPVNTFDVDNEISFIKSQAQAGTITAVGECGLDGYWVSEETFPTQERVFTELINIALEFDLPLIIHSRKREKRCIEILEHHGVKRVDFHCYGGKVKLAIKAAEKNGWWFSIPANCRSNEAFTKMMKELPEKSILTETDSPYLAPTKGNRNEPCSVKGTVDYLGELRSWSFDEARDLIWNNYLALFYPKNT